MSFLDRLNGPGREAVLGKLREAGLREYGYLNEDLAEKISRAVEGHGPADGPLPAAGGLNNHDFSHMLLKVIEDEPEKVLNGLQAVAWLAGAERMYLYLPEKETALAGDRLRKSGRAGAGCRGRKRYRQCPPDAGRHHLPCGDAEGRGRGAGGHVPSGNPGGRGEI